MKKRTKRFLGIGGGVIALLLIMVMMLGALGTGAWFSDQESSTGNTITAGTLDLTVDGQDDPNVAHMVVSDMKPNDTEYQYWVLKNTGSIDGQPSITFGSVTNNDNGLTEPESDVDSTGGDGEGELGANVYVMMRWRQAGGEWQNVRLTNNWGNPLLNSLPGTTVGLGLLTANGQLVDNPLPVLSENEEVEVEFRVWIMNSVGNIIQSDSSEFDITFKLDQVH